MRQSTRRHPLEPARKWPGPLLSVYSLHPVPVMPTRIVRLDIPNAWHSEMAALKARLASVGLALPPGSRLASFARTIDAMAGGSFSARDQTDPRLHSLLEGARDFGEMHMAAMRLLPTDDPALVVRFRRALGGSTMPVNRNPDARSTQFELYLAAVLTTTGHQVEFAEPDIILAYPGLEIAVAAKRIETPRKYRTRLKEGVEQIERSGRRGIVAVLFDHVGPNRYPGIIAETADDIQRRAPQILRDTVDPLREATLRATVGRPVLALLATVALPAIVPSQNRIGRLAGMLLRIIEVNTSVDEKRVLEQLPAAMTLPDA